MKRRRSIKVKQVNGERERRVSTYFVLDLSHNRLSVCEMADAKSLSGKIYSN